jgi:predicted alpha/beta hydrolase family esterase
VVASDNDHVTEIERSKEFARNWGSQLVVLKNAGHIEPSSGFGNWSLGLELIEKLENPTF